MNSNNDDGVIEWRSQYPPEAKKWIWIEGIYGLILILISPVLIWLFLAGYPGVFLNLTETQDHWISVIGVTWIGGMLGGAVFSTKWLIHAVGEYKWYRDRQLWRFITPHAAGAITLGFITLLDSNFLPIVTITETMSLLGLVGLAFFVGYFADSVIGQFASFAEGVFGRVESGSVPNEVKQEQEERE